MFVVVVVLEGWVVFCGVFWLFVWLVGWGLRRGGLGGRGGWLNQNHSSLTIKCVIVGMPLHTTHSHGCMVLNVLNKFHIFCQ